jgi:hypothetical protein
MYASTAARIIVRSRPWTRVRPRPRSERHIFVVGAPRSGTTFLATSLGAQPGLVDLGEVKPLKAAIPELMAFPEEQAAERFRRIIELVHRLGLSGQLRGVEQTPETAFVLAAALRAYPEARAVHMLRDGRDVVCSLLERGWLGTRRMGGADDAFLPYGADARFWVEPGREAEFEASSEARRAAWAWQRYVSAVLESGVAVHEVRYERLAADSETTASDLALALGAPEALLVEALSEGHTSSIGRYKRDLTPDQLADVEAEAGDLLQKLDY